MAKSTGGNESEHHVVGVRLRVIGEGNLNLELSDLSSVQQLTLAPLAMESSTRFEPTVLSNFQSQRICLSGETTEIDEWFQIKRIILYAKPVATEYPM